jgi:hypothetical protein
MGVKADFKRMFAAVSVLFDINYEAHFLVTKGFPQKVH